MTPDLMQRLWSGAEKLGVNLDSEQRRQLQLFASEIELWNPRLGLVNAEGEELISKHFLDSLAAVPRITQVIQEMGYGNRVAAVDLGSGNGFPGIVLQIAIPQLRMTLVERSSKRCGFLRNVAALLPALPLQIQQCDLSDVDGEFSLVFSRAFRPLQPGIVAGMQRITAPDGTWILYKGDPENARNELETAGLEGEVLPLQIPGVSEKRCLVVCRS
ncbi:MAG: 16S rRNA (guanine(527)-N(7))-methyltransferase RsmG [Spirochaeta sp.]